MYNIQASSRARSRIRSQMSENEGASSSVSKIAVSMLINKMLRTKLKEFHGSVKNNMDVHYHINNQVLHVITDPTRVCVIALN